MSQTSLVGNLMPKPGQRTVDCELPSMTQTQQRELMFTLINMGYSPKIRQTERCTVAVYAVKA